MSGNNSKDFEPQKHHNEATIASHRIYTGKVISLDVDQVRYPDSSTGEMEVVRHPGACAIVPFLSDPAGDDPQILLLRQYRYATGGYLYEIPAGRLNEGETPAQCAERELREETGCSAQQLELLYSTFTTPGFSDEKIHIFMAVDLTHGATATDTDEFIESVPTTLSQSLRMIQQGEIQDAKTALGILYAAGFAAGR